MWGYFQMRNIYYKTVREINKVNKKIQALLNKVTYPRLMKLDGMPRSNSNLSILDVYLIRKEELEAKKEILLTRKFGLENDLNTYLDGLNLNKIARKIIEIKTFDLERPWKEICNKTKLSRSYAIKIYSEVIDKIIKKENVDVKIHNKSN